MNLIIDACSMILLAKASVLEACVAMHSITVTTEVYNEVLEGKKKVFPDALLLERLVNEKKIRLLKADTKITNKLMQDFHMAKGEASTIAFGIKEKDVLVVTDNKQGRKAAQIHGLHLVGSIEIIISLYRKKKIESSKAKEAIKKLQEYGWFHSSLIEKAMEDIEND